MVTLNDKPLQKLRRTLKKLTGARLKVGFFDGESASVAAFQEFGTINIPARPFIRSAIELGADEIRRGQVLVLKGVYEGRFSAKEAADALADFVKRLILKRLDEAIRWAAPLDAATIAKKGNAIPLVDTGTMRDALRVEVKL